jgi:hypothetical protein
MTDIVLIKAASGALVPADQQSIEYISKMKLGGAVTATVKRHNNPAFHRKMFALLNLAFEHWEPDEKEYKGQRVQKNFDQLRKDITILAGYYETVITFRGDVRVVAKSLNFSSMGPEERESLYSSIINVVLAKILTNYTRDDLDNVINQVLAFT